MIPLETTYKEANKAKATQKPKKMMPSKARQFYSKLIQLDTLINLRIILSFAQTSYHIMLSATIF
jgi:hypothetical protein